MLCVPNKNGVVDMALKEPDMGICSYKKVCHGGPNDGLAYDPEDPCRYMDHESFSYPFCDCIPILPREPGYWRWTGTITTIPFGSPKNDDASMSGGFIPNCSGNGSVTCTTPWFFANFTGSGTNTTQTFYTWKSDVAATTFQPDTDSLIRLRGAGVMVHIGACTGSWNVAKFYSINVVGDYDPEENPGTGSFVTPANIVINGGGASCFGGLDTYTEFFGSWQFSPNQNPDNITFTVSPDPILWYANLPNLLDSISNY